MKLRSLVLVGYLVPLAILYAAHPAPFILQPLVPATVRPGSGDVTLSITGTGFAKSSVVYWNSNALATTYVTSRQLRATIPAALIASPGGASIAVVNPAPGGGASNAIPFEVTTVVGTVALSSTFNPTGVQPGVVVTGDFNRDGKLDLATVNVGAKTISILLGNGDGTFQTAANYAGLSQIDALATADFNGDGILDLVLPGTIPAIMFGNGDGSFQPPISIVLDQAISVAVGDVNGDGKEDLILGLGSGVSIWLGNGNGTFTQSWSGLSLSVQTEDIAITDLNNDGIPDIALAQPDIPGMRILLGKGDGTFTIGQQYSAPPYDYSIAAADLNGDGFQDLVVGSTNATITVYLGNGDGTFQPQVGYPLPNYTYAITLGDFNGDGKIDILSVGVNEAYLLLGNGDGTLQAALVLPVASGTAFTVVAGDFNSDGRLDAAFPDNFLGVYTALQTTMQVTPVDLGYRPQTIGSRSLSQELHLTDTSGTLAIGPISIAGQNSADFSATTNCPGSLQPAHTCEVSVIFNPTAEGLREASLSIFNQTLGVPQIVDLYGTGTILALSPGLVNFGSIAVGGSSAPQTVTPSNLGTVPVNFTSITVAGTNRAGFTQTNSCGSSLAPGASCTAQVTFSPQSTGAQVAYLMFSDDAGGNSQNVSLTGTGQ